MAVVADRDVGTLVGAAPPPPPPPPRAGNTVSDDTTTTTARIARSNSAVSATSNSSSRSFTRSSSFTRSRKFARGDSMTLEDARKVLDSTNQTIATSLKFAAAQLILTEHLPGEPKSTDERINVPDPPEMPENYLRNIKLKDIGPMPPRVNITFIESATKIGDDDKIEDEFEADMVVEEEKVVIEKEKTPPPKPNLDERFGAFSIAAPAAVNFPKAEIPDKQDIEPSSSGPEKSKGRRTFTKLFSKSRSNLMKEGADGQDGAKKGKSDGRASFLLKRSSKRGQDSNANSAESPKQPAKIDKDVAKSVSTKNVEKPVSTVEKDVKNFVNAKSEDKSETKDVKDVSKYVSIKSVANPITEIVKNVSKSVSNKSEDKSETKSEMSVSKSVSKRSESTSVGNEDEGNTEKKEIETPLEKGIENKEEGSTVAAESTSKKHIKPEEKVETKFGIIKSLSRKKEVKQEVVAAPKKSESKDENKLDVTKPVPVEKEEKDQPAEPASTEKEEKKETSEVVGETEKTVEKKEIRRSLSNRKGTADEEVESMDKPAEDEVVPDKANTAEDSKSEPKKEEDKSEVKTEVVENLKPTEETVVNKKSPVVAKPGNRDADGLGFFANMSARVSLPTLLKRPEVPTASQESDKGAPNPRKSTHVPSDEKVGFFSKMSPRSSLPAFTQRPDFADGHKPHAQRVRSLLASIRVSKRPATEAAPTAAAGPSASAATSAGAASPASSSPATGVVPDRPEAVPLPGVRKGDELRSSAGKWATKLRHRSMGLGRMHTNPELARGAEDAKPPASNPAFPRSNTENKLVSNGVSDTPKLRRASSAVIPRANATEQTGVATGETTKKKIRLEKMKLPDTRFMFARRKNRADATTGDGTSPKPPREAKTEKDRKTPFWRKLMRKNSRQPVATPAPAAPAPTPVQVPKGENWEEKYQNMKESKKDYVEQVEKEIKKKETEIADQIVIPGEASQPNKQPPPARTFERPQVHDGRRVRMPGEARDVPASKLVVESPKRVDRVEKTPPSNSPNMSRVGSAKKSLFGGTIPA